MAKVVVGRKFKTQVLMAMLLSLVAYPSWAEDREHNGRHEECCEPAERDFPYVGGNLGNTRFSRLDHINTRNIDKLGGAWHVNLEGGALVSNQQSTPVVVDGVMYVQSAQQDVFAINAATGAIKWKYAAGGKTFNMRGVAVGGGMVFSTLSDKRVIALNKDTGALVWQTTVANDAFGSGGGGVPVNPGDVNPGALNASGTTPTAITYYDGLIYLGTGGGDGGFRGRFYALKAGTGEVAWTFYTTPSPGQLGSDTWEGNSWATGGAAPWMQGALDPELGLFYFTAGQPWPVTNGSTRGGNNLFASSIIAVNSKTGEYRWHYQMSHHDLWDYDMVVAPVLLDLQEHPWDAKRKAVAIAGKTGFLYLFDRTNGKPLVGINEEPVPQDARQKTSPTQPIPIGDAFVPQCTDRNAPATSALHPVPNYLAGCIFSPFWDQPTIATPGSGGGADWGYSSFNPRTQLLYVSAGLINSAYVEDSSVIGGGLSFFRPLGENKSGMIAAINPVNNKVVWQRPMKWSLAHNHLLTTAGDLIFVGQPDGYLVALDIKDGRELWRFQTGAGVHTGPITYKIGRDQYVAVLAGGNGLPYNSPAGDHLWAFKLDGNVPEAAVPTPPSVRQPITVAAVTGAQANNTVTLARTWSASSNAPGTTESLSQNAMAPQYLVVPIGTTVTFVNPATNTKKHCATQFFEGLFNFALNPGQTATYTFTSAGEYFYNDCTQPQTTGKVVVQ